MLFKQTFSDFSHFILYHIPRLAWLDVFLLFFSFLNMGHFKQPAYWKAAISVSNQWHQIYHQPTTERLGTNQY